MNGARTGFRPDINGLRAIAVLGVIAFHFKLSILRAGGFAGVDVFFVISGFLMTQIIVGRLDRSAFLLKDFLLARTRRIVPAFVAAVIGVLLIGLVLLNPLQLEEQAERAVWSLFFLSNFLYAHQGTYFFSPDQNWLLHTWSLSVEWQFYLIFPLLLLLLRKLGVGRRGEVAVLSVIALISCVVMVRSLSAGGDAPTYNFYMLSSRAWEFLLGALVAYALPYIVMGPRARQTLHYGGLAGIVLAMMVFHNTTPWPSPWTALPVLCTAAMLLARHDAPAWVRFTPVQLGGLWSYSIYLWHWPIAAALSFFGHWSLIDRLVGIAVSLVLGWISYEFIERRATDFVWQSRRRLWTLGLASTLGVVAFVMLVFKTDGLESVRYAFRPELLARLREYRTAYSDWHDRGYCDQYVRRTDFIEECRFGNLQSKDVLVLGDSFAGELTPRYKGTLGTSSGVTFVTRGGCAPLPDTETIEFGSICNKWTEDAYHYALASDFKRVVFVAFWPFYEQGRLCLLDLPNCGNDLDRKAYADALNGRYQRLGEIWRELKRRGKDVVVFGLVPIPGHEASPSVLYTRVAAGGARQNIDLDYAVFRDKYRETARRLAETAAFAGATLVEPGVALCPHGKCPVVRDGRPLYADGKHFRASLMKDPRFAVYDRYIVPGKGFQTSAN